MTQTAGSFLAYAKAGSELLPLVLEQKQQFETRNVDAVGPVARVICHFREHCLLYSMLRHQLYLDLRRDDVPFLAPQSAPIFPSLVELVSGWLSRENGAAQMIKRVYRFYLTHAIKTLFEVVLVCGMPRNCLPNGLKDHPIIQQFHLLSYCDKVVRRCSGDKDEVLSLGESWKVICQYLDGSLPSCS